MATRSNLITKQQMVDDINVIPTTKNNAVVWRSGGTTSGSTTCNAWLGALVSGIPVSNLANTVTASDIVTQYKTLAKQTTRYWNFRVSRYLQGVCANYYTYDVTNKAVLTADYEDATRKANIDAAASPAVGDVLTADSINNFVTALSTLADINITQSNSCQENYCHCNCHGSCHGSRARR